MRVVIRSGLGDVFAFVASVGKRNRIFRKASSQRLPEGPMNLLAESLHPRAQSMRIVSVERRSKAIFSYRMVSVDPKRKPAFFRAGQYVSCHFRIGSSLVSRPYSLSSTPADAAGAGFYEITAKHDEDGFVGARIAELWRVGTEVACSGPAGCFHYQEGRDAPEMICLAGGSGITPFRSMIPDGLENFQDVSFRLFQGAEEPEDLAYRDDFLQLQHRYGERFTYVPVCARELITRRLIEESLRLDGRQSFFVCGPPGMQAFLDEELSALNLPRKRVRRENYGAPAVSAATGSASSAAHSISLLHPEGAALGSAAAIPADPGETILVALERAGLNPPALCRGGECGWCRSRLVSGRVSTIPERPGIRQADEKFGYIHPCVSFPRSDIVIDIPRNPIRFQP